MVFNLDILNFKKDISLAEARKESFESIETGYTARIKQTINGKKHTYLYSHVRKDIPKWVLENYNIFILKNINKTRALARKFELDRISSYQDLGWSALLSNLPKDLYIWCVDIKSAYFNSAVNLGLFKREYVEDFEKSFNKEVGYNELYKPSRLVVLGSLATKRRSRQWVNGICKTDTGYKVYDEKMRDVYALVCKEVDDLMIELNIIPGTVGYYWDCVFTTSEKSALEVKEALRKKDFDCKIEKRKSSTYYYPNGGGCLITHVDKDEGDRIKYQFNYRKVLAV